MENKNKDLLKEYRDRIAGIDSRISSLFVERLETSRSIAEYKKENSIPVYDPVQERKRMSEIVGQVPDEMQDYSRQLYGLIFEISKDVQNREMGKGSALTAEIQNAIENTPKLFPTKAVTACQGVEGANSQTACERLIRNPDILFFSGFDAVFSAVEKGLCAYGIVPVENSTAGSVNAVYDLMQKHRFSIVRSVRIKINHDLMVKPGTRIEDIREIYSHEHAIAQCSQFLQTFRGVKIIPCENTAAAAQMVSASETGNIAALSSRRCARLYGLEILKEAVQNRSNNYTRFICISKKLEIYPGADRTSIMLTLPNEQGALYKLLSRFYALGINLIKLESRPIPDRDFEFRFYFDLDVPVYSPAFIQLMGDISDNYEGFNYLGSYSEVV